MKTLLRGDILSDGAIMGSLIVFTCLICDEEVDHFNKDSHMRIVHEIYLGITARSYYTLQRVIR